MARMPWNTWARSSPDALFILPPMFKWGPFTYHSHRYGIATLARFSVRLPGGHKLMLHHFDPHEEIAWHDHPWDFRTIVLWGAYTDESRHPDPDSHDGYRIVSDHLGWLSRRRRTAEHAHRTRSLRGALTLVLTSPSRREWCHSEDSADLPYPDWTCQA